MPNVLVILSSGDTLTTDSTGVFIFDSITSFNNLTVTFSRDINISNGISGVDLVRMTNHLLGVTPFTSNLQILAGDTNGDGNLSAADLVVLRNAILGLITEFPNSESWGFVPNEITLMGAPTTSFDIEAFKVGDVTGDADPNN